MRDQTRGQGYLLHLLGVRQVAVIVNKMDRVNYSEARFSEIGDEISAHREGLGPPPTAIGPVSAREGDGVTRRTANIDRCAGPTVAEALDQFDASHPPGRLRLRLPVQAIYKFDDRRIVAGASRQAASAPAARSLSCRRARSRGSAASRAGPGRPTMRGAAPGGPIGITLNRQLFVERGDIIDHVDAAPRDTRRILLDEPVDLAANI